MAEDAVGSGQNDRTHSAAGTSVQFAGNFPSSSWRQHLMREQSCRLIAGAVVRLATEGVTGIEDVTGRGDAFVGWC